MYCLKINHKKQFHNNKQRNKLVYLHCAIRLMILLFKYSYLTVQYIVSLLRENNNFSIYFHYEKKLTK